VGLSHASALRAALSARAREWAARTGAPHYLSLGKTPVVLFERHQCGHGNFHPASFERILGDPRRARRLAKPHQVPSALPAEKRAAARELDSSMSSDALLMNIFCYPGAPEGEAFALLTGCPPGAEPEFGFEARVPLIGGRVDRTEVDLHLPGQLIESKLTEADFTSKPAERLETYRDFGVIFERGRLVYSAECFEDYQLLRNVMAAAASGCGFTLIHDRRRPDLAARFARVREAIRIQELGRRCRALTWQELAAVSPMPLRNFLADKYGIVP
jgi:hypothetical protein